MRGERFQGHRRFFADGKAVFALSSLDRGQCAGRALLTLHADEMYSRSNEKT
jgi:hypothetical protein